MKVLMVHNYYGLSAPSGENQVFEAESALLRDRGNEVAKFTRHSDEIRARGALGAVQGALATPWNPWTAYAIRKAVESFRPDVVHVHNTFPLISPSIFHAIGQRAARVLTLHNYRLFCASALMTRDRYACSLCLDQSSVIPALIHRCYRNSILATVPIGLSIELHKRLGTWTKNVDAFIVMTENQKKLVIKAGISKERVFVKPNFYAYQHLPLSWSDRGKYVLFIGRLSDEKGCKDLVRAWINWGESAPELRIIGDGPLRPYLEHIVISNIPDKVKFLGFISEKEKLHQLSKSNLLVMPSLEYTETFGIVLIEAFAHGVPVAVSNVAPLNTVSSVGYNSVNFQPRDPESLLREVRTAWETPGLLERLGQGARAEFEARYTQNANYQTLIEIYAKAIATNKERARP